MTRDDLIEKIASLVYATVPASAIVPWRELDGNRRVEYEDAARAIRAVFEESLAPTGDDREAIMDALLDELGWDWDEVPEEHIPSSRQILGDMADRVLAVVAGFRRSEVPEPSAEGWSAEDRREALAEGLRRWSVLGQRECADQRDHDLYGMGARQGFVLGAEWWKATHPVAEPQGELTIPKLAFQVMQKAFSVRRLDFADLLLLGEQGLDLAPIQEQARREMLRAPRGEPSDAEAKVVAQHMAQASSDWIDIEGNQHEHTLHCTNWMAYLDDAHSALRAAAAVRGTGGEQ